MKVLGRSQQQTGTGLKFVPVQFSRSIDTMSKDHMMCSLYSNLYLASFFIGSSGFTDPGLARKLGLDA
jgi:hypothetical protein